MQINCNIHIKCVEIFPYFSTLCGLLMHWHNIIISVVWCFRIHIPQFYELKYLKQFVKLTSSNLTFQLCSIEWIPHDERNIYSFSFENGMTI